VLRILPWSRTVAYFATATVTKRKKFYNTVIRNLSGEEESFPQGAA